MRNLAGYKVNTLLIATWISLVFAYYYSLQNNIHMKSWDLTIYTIQLAVDIANGTLSYLLYKYRTDKVDRHFFLLLFVSFIFGLITNEIYNVLVNIAHIPKEIFNARYWSTTYAIFLFIQLAAWGREKPR